MCHLTLTMIIGALILVTLSKETSSFTIHRLSDASHLDPDDHDSHGAFINNQQISGRNPVVGLASLDGHLIDSSEEGVYDDSTSMEHQLVKRPDVHQLTPEVRELLFQHEINQDYMDSSEEVEKLFFQGNIHTADDYQRFLLNRPWTRDVSDEMQGSWQVKNVDWLKIWFGDSLKPVRDGTFDQMAVGDLTEVRNHQDGTQQSTRDERL